MKKSLITLLVLACCAPAIAQVDFAIVNNTDGTATITMDTGGDVVRGVGLLVTCTGGASLVDLSVADLNPAFNTNIDYAYANVGYQIGDGHPYADDAAAGEATATDTEFSISMGVLDQLGGQAGYTGSGDLLTINTGVGNVCIELDTLRGGVVGDVALTTNIDSAPICEDITIAVTDCVNIDAPFYAEWVGAGKNWDKPDCWCYERQCRGDVDGLKVGLFRVQADDLTIFASAFGKADAKLDQTSICADLDHKKVGLFRCQADDLTEFAAYFGKADLKVPVCPLDWDGDLDDDYNFWCTPGACP